MKKFVSEADVDRRVAEQAVQLAARGSTLPDAIARGLARMHLEMTSPSGASAPVARAKPVAAPVIEPPPRPAAKTGMPARAAAPAPSPPVLAERVRAQRIIAMTPKGAEDECSDAIRSGMPMGEFEGVLAARAILVATRLAQGR